MTIYCNFCGNYLPERMSCSKCKQVICNQCIYFCKTCSTNSYIKMTAAIHNESHRLFCESCVFDIRRNEVFRKIK